MKRLLLVAACLTLLWACERPKSPDFKLNQKFEAPLTVEKTYSFLGGSESLIDTTSEDFEELFSPDADGQVRITKNQEFNFGDLDDAVPEVNAAPASVNAEVGEISLTNFNSGSGNVGSAGFTSITGLPSALSKDDPVTAGSTPGTVNIPFSTDYFESAVIKKDGALQLRVTNNLGFDVDVLELTLKSGNENVGTASIGTDGDPNDNFNHGATKTATVNIPANISATDPLQDISVDISANWDTQQMQADGSKLVVNDVTGQNLVASQVTAAVESQSFNDSGTSDVDESNFQFRDSGDYVELGGGDLSIDINSTLEIGIESLDIVFPDIEDEKGQPLRLPPISFGGKGTYSKSIDLAGYRIKAKNGSVTYTINAKTENTQQGDGSTMSTINESDALDAEVTINNLQIKRAEGYIVPKTVLLNEDVNNDGEVDVFDNDEAEVTSINGLSDISDRISDVTFENPTLTIDYLTNLGVGTTIYAVIAGTNSEGETVYLTGKEGSDFDVATNEIPSELEANWHPVNENQVIKFSVKPVENPGSEGVEKHTVFTAEETNTSAFFSNLPTKIRFVGVAAINNSQTSGIIVNPVVFDPSLGVEIPFNFSANNATFKDTLDADLGDLPGKDDDQQLSEATLTVNYTNGLPIAMDLTMILVDANGKAVIPPKDGISIEGAPTDGQGYVTDAQKKKMQISFSEEELRNLYKTRNIRLEMMINTSEQKAVRIKEDDSVTLQIQLKAGITSTVN